MSSLNNVTFLQIESREATLTEKERDKHSPNITKVWRGAWRLHKQELGIDDKGILKIFSTIYQHLFTKKGKEEERERLD
jgi:hypothetical protein